MRVVLGLGGNLGDREENLRRAVELLDRLPETKVVRCSNVYETEPFDVRSEQEKYLNACVLVETSLAPEKLLDKCLATEAELGRVRLEYHGARTVDIDLLVCEGFTSQTQKLTVPHPGILQRAFVMVPLMDLFPDGEALGVTFGPALDGVDKAGIALYAKAEAFFGE